MSTTTPVSEARRKTRNGIFSRGKPKFKVIDYFGEQVEVRQPTMRALLNMQTEESNTSRRAAMMIVDYCFVPGTDEKIFEPADVDALQEMPFGEDMRRMQDAINELTGVSTEAVDTQAKNSEETSTD